MKFIQKMASFSKFWLIAALVLIIVTAVVAIMEAQDSPSQRIVQSELVYPGRVAEQTVPDLPKLPEFVRGPYGPPEYFGPGLPLHESKEIADLKVAPSKPDLPKKKNPSEPVISFPKGTGKVVIIIDDMGVDKRSHEVVALPGPLTLSYLPYARDLPAQTTKAKVAGHELMIHIPMEPQANNIDPGPDVLTTSMNEAQLDAALDRAFNSFNDYVGINNHMGSKITEDRPHMEWLMAVLKKRGLLFIDSMTSPNSVGADVAREYGLAYNDRDVFLDHQTDLASVQASLRHLEALAYKNGVAIAIGHPKLNTIAALAAWLPTLKNKNLTLIPVSQAVHRSQPVTVATPMRFGPPLPPR